MAPNLYTLMYGGIMFNNRTNLIRSMSVISASLLLITAFQNCGQAGQITEAEPESVFVDEDPIQPPQNIEDQFQAYTKLVNINAPTSKVDILIVVDNSGSMEFEQSNMADRFDTLIDQLAGLDWRLAITTTEINTANRNSPSRADGRILQIVNNKYFISSSDDMNLARQQFANTIQRQEEGSSSEQGIYATYRALERAKESGSLNSSFIRSDAALSVVVVSDANETPFGGVFTDRNYPTKFLEYMATSYAGKSFSFHSIIVKKDDRACLNLAGSGNEGYGLFYEDLSTRTGGVVGSVCEADYGSQLRDIGKASANLVRNISLDCAPVDSDRNGMKDVVITNVMNPAAVIPAYTVNGNQLQFAVALDPAQYRVNYICAVTAAPAP